MDAPRARLRAGPLIRVLRPHQWVKNALVFLPLLLSHQPGDAARVDEVVAAFVAFCLCASFGYVVNDLRDLDADRSSPHRRRRPFASGELPTSTGVPLAAALLVIGIGISVLLLPRNATLVVVGYTVATVVYSLALKQRLLVDVVFLAGLYTLRLLAGGAAAALQLTPWLLAFSMFFFISLAFAKRYVELLSTPPDGNDERLRARRYRPEDAEMIRSVGPAAGYSAVLVMAIYINSDMARARYAHPFLLWLVCPVVLYWITRIWFFAGRGALHEDPILFAIKDRVSWLAGASVVTLVALAALLP
jgi:4-hydroxybenzoate polyprenyltransferase